MSKLKPLYPHPAALLTERGEVILLIADLHIAFEEMFNLGSADAEAGADGMLQELTTLITTHKPEHLYVIGDVKSRFDTITRLEWKLVPQFLRTVSSKVKTTVIPGNHDGALHYIAPKEVTLESSAGILVGDTGLLHGHAMPSDTLRNAARLVIAHAHPTFHRPGSPLTGSPVWLFLKAPRETVFQGSGSDLVELVVMPSFNRSLYSIGFSVQHEDTISPVLRRVQPDVTEGVIITL